MEGNKRGSTPPGNGMPGEEPWHVGKSRVKARRAFETPRPKWKGKKESTDNPIQADWSTRGMRGEGIKTPTTYFRSEGEKPGPPGEKCANMDTINENWGGGSSHQAVTTKCKAARFYKGPH